MKPAIAIWSPLPPVASGIADYTVDLLPYLAPHYDIELFVDDGYEPDYSIMAHYPVYHHSDYDRRHRARNFIATIHQFGNSPKHWYQYEQMLDHDNVVLVLHDLTWSLSLWNVLHQQGVGHAFRLMVRSLYGSNAERHYVELYKRAQRGETQPLTDWLYQFHMTDDLTQHARAVITHTPVEHHDDPLREHWHYIPQAAAQVKIDKSKARADLGIDSFDYVVGVFGHVARNKRLESAIQAFRLLLDDHPNSLLIIAGPHDEPAYTEMLNNVASGLEDRISIPGAVNTVSWQTMLGACDVAIQLRDKSMGASSRAVNQVIAAGRPVIISDIPEWRYPETVAKRVPHGDLEIATLLQHLQTLADVDVQKAANQAALEYYRQNNSIEMMAARYRQIITQVASQAYIASHGVRPIRMSLDARLSEVIRESA